LTEGLALNQVRRAAEGALVRLPTLPEWQEPSWVARERFPPFDASLRALHHPTEPTDLLPDGAAWSRLAYDELLAGQVALALVRAHLRRPSGRATPGTGHLRQRLIESLPFSLTPSQVRAISEIISDLAKPERMLRLLQGDVGSGKTVVALLAAAAVVEAGRQAAVMAPTELLAEQHYATCRRLCKSIDIRAELLCGTQPASHRRRVLLWLARGEPGIVFGTQALIQRKVEIPRLGLGLIDEQHRFGVFDRVRLQALGPRADMLLLSATPIPRSLARVLLSNLEVSILEERPAGRPPVTTHLVEQGELAAVWRKVRDEVARGNRAYCILPLIESDDQQELAVTTAAAELRERALAGLRVGVMHGRLAAEEKDRVMRQFRDGKLQVLVSTTVIEVGIDVPEATVMVIMGAQRYGLAQLHQLRGRIGRGTQPGDCYLVVNGSANGAVRNKLKVLVDKTSGADIAQADLELRGPGDLFGARQAGPLPLRFAHWMKDFDTIVRLRDLARAWLRRDPQLNTSASRGARAVLAHLLEAGASAASVG